MFFLLALMGHSVPFKPFLCFKASCNCSTSKPIFYFFSFFFQCTHDEPSYAFFSIHDEVIQAKQCHLYAFIYDQKSTFIKSFFFFSFTFFCLLGLNTPPPRSPQWLLLCILGVHGASHQNCGKFSRIVVSPCIGIQ